MTTNFNGSDLKFVVESGGMIGAVSLISPTTGRPDLGLVVQPRFPWDGLGPLLAEMGWVVSPKPLTLPLVPRSERKVPHWVLATVVLRRLAVLLDSLEKRFELIDEIRNAPRGSIDWGTYLTSKLPRALFLSVPCRYPVLQENTDLLGAIRFTLERQIRSLETQRSRGTFVQRLLSSAEALHRRVADIPVKPPSARDIERWKRSPVITPSVREGVEAIEWTVEERGLGGLSELNGLAWNMSMSDFFEAWVETVLRKVARSVGGQLKTGRRRETVAPLRWDPPFSGSQRSLVPDFRLELESAAVIIDAKYKRHWEELVDRKWAAQDESLREEHRADLFQALAYANLARSRSVVTCLVYPCTLQTWQSLCARDRVFQEAELPAGDRQIRVWLTALPMQAAVDDAARPFTSRVLQLSQEVREDSLVIP